MKFQLLFRGMSASTGLKNPWRNSACLILVTGPFRYGHPPLPRAVAKVAEDRYGSTPPVILEAEEGGGAWGEGGRESVEMLYVQRGNRKTTNWVRMYVCVPCICTAMCMYVYKEIAVLSLCMFDMLCLWCSPK